VADAAHSSFVEYVQDQLSGLGGDGVTVRPMFGGHGLSCRGTFFGIAYDGRLYFKTNASTVSRYEAAGSA
jgi:TfoX/Sxy family transcriptional regulator of competence genes